MKNLVHVSTIHKTILGNSKDSFATAAMAENKLMGFDPYAIYHFAKIKTRLISIVSTFAWQNFSKQYYLASYAVRPPLRPKMHSYTKE